MTQYPITRYSFQDLFGNPSQNEMWKLAEPPKEIFVQGSPKALALFRRLPNDGLAIVGTRAPQPRSVQFVKQKVSDLVGTNLIILSGLALGIDTIAHTAAIAAKIPTIAILGNGLDISYPRKNQELRNRILNAHGLIVSEFPTGTPAFKHHFLRRNRLIAGWSKATCVIEASYRSGALNTARWARDQDRTCFSVPCYPGDPAFAGNQILLDRDHALPLWDIHSLGSVWLDLATHTRNSQGTLLFPETDDSSILAAQIKQFNAADGSADIPQLLNWSASIGWPPRRFFHAFQKAIDQKQILECGNSLVSG